MAAQRRWIIIVGWEKFQHRDAARRRQGLLWHKVYADLLHRDEYLELSLAQRGILHGLWLMRAQSEVLSEDRARTVLVGRRAQALRHWRDNLKALEQAGFITLSASKPASSPASEPASLEVEVDKEKDLRFVRTPSTSRGTGNGTDQEFSTLNPQDILAGMLPT